MSGDRCGTFSDALASINTSDEMAGFAWGCRQPWSWPLTEDEWSALALRKIQIEQREKANGK